MKLSVTRTTKIVSFGGQKVRVWRGTNEDGRPCDVLVAAVFVHDREDRAAFERELAANDGEEFVPLCQGHAPGTAH